MIGFVSGAARSGKSAYAERMAFSCHQGSTGRLVYAATALAADEEMQDRIARHRADRSSPWQTVECPYDLNEAIHGTCRPGDTIVLDCLTTWLSQVMYDRIWSEADIRNHLDQMVSTVREMKCTIVIVSNDVNEGFAPAAPEVNRYIYVLEVIHRQLIGLSDLAVQVVAGIPFIWKKEPGIDEKALVEQANHI